MIATYVITALTIVCMTCSFFVFPSVKVGKGKFDTYWMVTSVGAIALLLANIPHDADTLSLFVQNNATNPFKIIVLFLSLTLISKFLDSAGLFDYLATRVGRIGKGNQLILFTVFYFLICFLTMLTNNDIIIIVTPIVIRFARACKVKAMPYLIMVVFVLNTLSATFLTTNVSNLYLGSFFGVTYIDYLAHMTPVSLILMVILYLLLIAVFWRDLRVRIQPNVDKAPIKDRFILGVGLFSLIGTTILLIISNYIGLEMYIITLGFALFDLVASIAYCLSKKKDKALFTAPVKALPYEFIPFLLSMFVIISALNQTPLLSQIGQLLSKIANPGAESFTYGVTSALAANLVNNVPMALLYGDILNATSSFETVDLHSVYSCILASNLCALITPCGALSSLMFMRICKENNEKMTYGKYLSYSPIGIALLASGLGLILLF